MKKEIRINHGLKKFFPWTENITLYYNDVRSRNYSEKEKELTDKLLIEYQTANGELKEKIRNKIVELNLRLVISLARQYCSEGEELLDLIEEGNIGLIEAVERFDITRDSCFSKVALIYIMRAITQYRTDKSSVIRHRKACTANLYINKITDKYLHDIGREPSLDEIYSEYQSEGKDRLKKEDFVPFKFVNIKDFSVDGYTEDSKGWRREDKDIYKANTCHLNGYEEEIERDYNKEYIRSLLKHLTPNERKVIKLFYGLEGEKMDYNYHSIAKILNITPQRVGQLYLSAIKRLKEKLNIEIKEDLNNDTSNRIN